MSHIARLKKSGRWSSYWILGIAGLVSLIALAAVPFQLIQLPQTMLDQTAPKEEMLTAEDELVDNGDIIWLTRIIFPSLNQGWMLDLQSFGSGPKIEKIEQVDEKTVRVIGHNGSIEIFSSQSYRRITIKANYVSNNFMPGVKAGDVIEHFEEAPVFRYRIDVPQLGIFSMQGFDSYGKAVLYRGGVQHDGFGTYLRATASRLFDPSFGFFVQIGWVSNPEFILFHYELPGVHESAIQWRNGQREEVLVNTKTTDCRSFTYTFSTSRGEIIIEMDQIKYVIGVPCKIGEAYGRSNANIGGKGLAWALAGR